MINKELETLIEDSKARGVWSGYVRQECSEAVFDELLESGYYVKMKTINPVNAGDREGATLWAIVKKGFERSIFSK